MWGLYINDQLHREFQSQGDAWLYATDNSMTEVYKKRARFKHNVKLMHPTDHKKMKEKQKHDNT